ncbi:hypothetical protein sscle_12g087670 [Sclerotinia sclerotiorum 1980 UF-70]|uniref:2EXR domain-containing protein n=1 Tax=Sclerotinia sclerotiorum (strain ATCC 18683 / 1980 / Ss-1) TaxID=665079 RepID=A0A1D9QGD0_SCLS1|nr:hypothetical protein sscle_12g087670 [Sclerotinia sclerotiorum 1980 UF-70]
MESLSRSSDTSSEELTTFSYFPALPTELRLKIWHLHIHPRRKLNIGLKLDYKHRTHPAVLGWFIARAKIGSTEVNPIPAILHVNREAREAGLTSYELAPGKFDRAGTAYINFERDVLTLDLFDEKLLPMILTGFRGAGAEKIMNLEFNVIDLNAFCWDYIQHFSSLRILTLELWEMHIHIDELSSMRDKLRTSARKYPKWKVPEVWVDFRRMKSLHRLEL